MVYEVETKWKMLEEDFNHFFWDVPRILHPTCTVKTLWAGSSFKYSVQCWWMNLRSMTRAKMWRQWQVSGRTRRSCCESRTKSDVHVRSLGLTVPEVSCEEGKITARMSSHVVSLTIEEASASNVQIRPCRVSEQQRFLAQTSNLNNFPPRRQYLIYE